MLKRMDADMDVVLQSMNDEKQELEQELKNNKVDQDVISKWSDNI